MKPEFTHIALHVRDIARTVDFYRDYCKLEPIREREDNGVKVAWLAETDRADGFFMVLIDRGPGHRPQKENDFSHLGFAVESRAAVDRRAKKAETEGRLAWPARQEPDPTGYICGVFDPDGVLVEFSYGQNLDRDPA